jgi:undecaprenyl-diphosphatase
MFSIFKNINYLAGKSKLLDWFAVFCAKYLLYVMIMVLFLSAVELHSRGIFFYSLLAGLVAAFCVNTIIYIFYKKRRPAELKSAKVLIAVPQNPSFPSRHAALAFGMSFYVFFYSIPLAIVFIICSCLIGISRVFCGVHWFSDILGGVISGLLSTIIIYYLYLLIR